MSLLQDMALPALGLWEDDVEIKTENEGGRLKLWEGVIG